MLRRTRGLRATAETLLVTRGSEHGIDLVARTLLAPGDVVAVEEMGWPTAWSALRLAGARLVALPLRDGGLDTEALAALASREPVRAVFVTPHRQFPTTAVMPAKQRARLSQLALQHRFAIIEEEEDHEFYYEEKPLLPISAGSSNAIYLGSLSNFLTPGLGTGFIFAPPLALERFAALKAASDPKCDAAVECAIAELFEDGEMLRHMRRMRRVYGSRRDALADALRRYLKGALTFDLPDGGMALWARVDDSIDVSEWVRAANPEGVIFCDSRAYDFLHRDQPFVRLGFTYHDEAELADAARRMAQALKNISHVRPKVARRAASSR